MARDKTLIKRQELLDFIRMYRSQYNMSPTLQEMAKAIYGDESNAGNVSTMLVKPLIREGFLYSARKGAASVQLVTPQPRKVYYKREGEVEKA